MNKLTRLLAAAVIPFLVCALLFGCQKAPDPIPEITTEYTFAPLTTEEDPWDTTEEPTEEHTEEPTEEPAEPTTRRTTTTTRRTTTTTKKTTTTTRTTTRATTTTNRYTTIPSDDTKATTTAGPTTTKPTTTAGPTTTATPTTVRVTGVKFEGTATYSLKMPATQNLGNSYTVSPSNATNKNVTFVSTNANVASVSNAGVVTAKGEGTCQIIVKTADGDFQDSVTVNVEIVPVTEINISSPGGASVITQGQTLQLTARAVPTNASNTNITWSVDNSAAASISSSGLLTAKTGGNVEQYVKVTAKAADGKGAERSVDITIKVPAE